MSWLMRSLLIWLLVLALPAQSVAVAAMVGCGLGHQAAVVAGGAAQVPQAHAHPHPHPHDADASASSGPAADATAAVAADGHKCSACAACCSAGAILNTVPSVPMPEFAALVFADWAASVAPFAVDGPDRPPRSILA